MHKFGMESVTEIEENFSTPDLSVTTTAFAFNGFLMYENMTGNGTYNDCAFYKPRLTFNVVQQARVIITSFLFCISAFGNVFVLYCLLTNRKRSHVHVITIHLTLADLVFTFFTIPMDAVWNITISWNGGVLLCKLCQCIKQFSMYISSSMMVVIALDRMLGILQPMSSMTRQKKRTRWMIGGAWALSSLSAIPSAILFTVSETALCPNESPFTQCVDNEMVPQHQLKVYYFFTMAMSFLIPFLLSIISYSLLICEIRNMQKRDRQIMCRRGSIYGVSIARAKKKALALTTIITLTYIVLWGPYYGIGIFSWFNSERAKHVPRETTVWFFLLMYLHPAVHPIIYGLYMKGVRQKLWTVVEKCFKWIPCHCMLFDSSRSLFSNAPNGISIPNENLIYNQEKSRIFSRVKPNLNQLK